jgi:predicted nuclease of predicted toxin-antitoxin system
VTFLFDDDVPDDLSHLLIHLGHRVTFLREVLPRDTPDAAVLDYAVRHGLIVVTCNRDDFVALGGQRVHHGIVIVIRRRSRAQERAALLRLLERATETGLANNINFA